MSALGIAGTIIFLLFGMGILLFAFWSCVSFGCDTEAWSAAILIPIMFIIIGIVIGIADSKLKKKSNKKRR